MASPLQDDDAPALGASRALVLDQLRAADGPVAVGEIARSTDLHPNTVRFHLDGLVTAGFAQRESEHRDRPGRPRVLYRATDHPGGERRSYRLLAEMLTGLIAESLPDPATAAIRAGQSWGGYLGDRPPPSRSFSTAEAVEHLVALLDGLGFAPEAHGAAPTRIGLRACPFREVAVAHPGIVCALHLGLMRGALEVSGAPVTAERLEPFVEPGRCETHLVTTGASAPRRRPGRQARHGETVRGTR